LLEVRMSRAIMAAEQSITAVAAAPVAAARLACGPGQPVLRVGRARRTRTSATPSSGQRRAAASVGTKVHAALDPASPHAAVITFDSRVLLM
jgi:hypothetical protein